MALDDVAFFKRYIKQHMAGTLSYSKSYRIRRILKKGGKR